MSGVFLIVNMIGTESLDCTRGIGLDSSTDGVTAACAAASAVAVSVTADVVTGVTAKPSARRDTVTAPAWISVAPATDDPEHVVDAPSAKAVASQTKSTAGPLSWVIPTSERLASPVFVTVSSKLTVSPTVSPDSGDTTPDTVSPDVPTVVKLAVEVKDTTAPALAVATLVISFPESTSAPVT